MGTLGKIGIAAGIAALLFWGFDAAKKALGAFSFAISRYGSPTLRGAFLQVPITVSFNNPSPVAINLDKVHADIYIQKFGQWIKAGVIDQPITLPPGRNEQTLVPQIDYGAILGGSLATTLFTVGTALLKQSVPVRTDITVTYGGVAFPTQSYTNNISIA